MFFRRLRWSVVGYIDGMDARKNSFCARDGRGEEFILRKFGEIVGLLFPKCICGVVKPSLTLQALKNVFRFLSMQSCSPGCEQM